MKRITKRGRACRWAVVSGFVVGALVSTEAVVHPQAGEPDNLQVLQGATPDELQLIMEATSASLGVECGHCHVPGSFASDDLPAKQTGRDMMRMVADLSTTTFELLESPSCWTCHRGVTSPESVQPPLLIPSNTPLGPFSESTSPAGEVYENVQAYGQLRANEFRAIMESYTRALGVGCDHCHVAGDWASDDNVRKPLARIMVQMQRSVTAELGLEDGAVSCWTCHRGEVTPQSNLPTALFPTLENP